MPTKFSQKALILFPYKYFSFIILYNKNSLIELFSPQAYSCSTYSRGVTDSTGHFTLTS